MDTDTSQSPLEIIELLELVLLHLDQGHILQLQRVSRFWYHTISGSPSLQQKLFFQPLPPSKAAGRPPEFNSLLESLFPCLFAPHPCLGAHMCQTKVEWSMQHWLGNSRRRKAILQPDASWRRMLPVQPAAPIEGVMLADYYPWNEFEKNSLEVCEVDPSKHASTLTARSDLGDNATMGLLYDIVLHYFNSTKYCHTGVYVQWNMFQFTHLDEYRDLRYHRPLRWTFFSTPASYPDRKIRSNYYRQVTPRNTITIHFSDVGCEGDCRYECRGDLPWLWRLARLPDGVLRTDRANRYSLGNVFRSYEIYGKVPARMEPVSEIEQNGKPRSEAGMDLLSQFYMDRADQP